MLSTRFDITQCIIGITMWKKSYYGTFLSLFMAYICPMKYNNQVKISMPDDTYYQLSRIKNITGKNLNDLIRSACEDFAKKEITRLKKMYPARMFEIK